MILPHILLTFMTIRSSTCGEVQSLLKRHTVCHHHTGISHTLSCGVRNLSQQILTLSHLSVVFLKKKKKANILVNSTLCNVKFDNSYITIEIYIN